MTAIGNTDDPQAYFDREQEIQVQRTLDRPIPSRPGGPILPPSLSTPRGQFRAGYIDAMLWANSGVYRERWCGTGFPGCSGWEWDRDDAHDDAMAFALPDHIRAELTAQADGFMEAHAALLAETIDEAERYSWDDAGHDFALTRNGHGAGFWDRGLGDAGDELTDLAEAEGELNVSVSIDRHGVETWHVE